MEFPDKSQYLEARYISGETSSTLWLLIICYWFLTEILSGLHLLFVPVKTFREGSIVYFHFIFHTVANAKSIHLLLGESENL